MLASLLCLEGAALQFFSRHVTHTFCLQVLKPLIIGYLINVKEGALVLLTPSGLVSGLPPRFTKRCPLLHFFVYSDLKADHLARHNIQLQTRSNTTLQPCSLCYTGDADADVQQCCVVACLYLLLCHQCSADSKAA